MSLIFRFIGRILHQVGAVSGENKRHEEIWIKREYSALGTQIDCFASQDKITFGS